MTQLETTAEQHVLQTEETSFEKEVGIVDSKTENLSESELIDQYKANTDWFVLVDSKTPTRDGYDSNDFKKEMRKNIVEAKLLSDDKVELFVKKEEDWESEKTSVRDFANGHNSLKALYQPVWTYAMIGLRWGIYVGLALKAIDLMILLGTVNAELILFFVLAIGATFIPRVGVWAIAAVSFFITRYTGVNFFAMAIGAGLAGVILGSLPGMFIGGLVGYIRRPYLPKAPDAEREGSSVLVNSILLPLIGGTAIILLYIFWFIPWAAETLM